MHRLRLSGIVVQAARLHELCWRAACTTEKDGLDSIV